MIVRIQGSQSAGRSQSSAWGDLVWTVAAATDENLDLAGQIRQTLETLEANLVELGSDKSRMLSAHVFIANIDDKPVMDNIWCDWIGENPEHWPQRACLGVELGGNWLIEVTVVAVRKV